MTLTPAEAREQLALDLASTSNWRRGKAVAHPDDPRHVEAAERLDRLVSSVTDVDDPTMDAYAALWDGLTNAEQHSEMLRAVGFSWCPNNALEFVRRYIAVVRGGSPDKPDNRAAGALISVTRGYHPAPKTRQRVSETHCGCGGLTHSGAALLPSR